MLMVAVIYWNRFECPRVAANMQHAVVAIPCSVSENLKCDCYAKKIFYK
ncbi:MAG: hypothetical protein LBJ00_04510 [Planctomycetaceae bacterium]|nr:hypothetical protein [Planctomycetaceae bacterium]